MKNLMVLVLKSDICLERGRLKRWVLSVCKLNNERKQCAFAFPEGKRRKV